MRHGSRIRRVLVAMLVPPAMFALLAAPARAEPPIVKPPVPPPVVGGWHLVPDFGAVGSTVTLQGFCGFPTSFVRWTIQDFPSFFWFSDPVFLKVNKFGTFSVKQVIPAVDMFGTPLLPGVHRTGVFCGDSAGMRPLNDQLLLVTESSRGSGPTR
jgi:hypothetical protein